jgi:hypothetical protein
MIEDLLPAPANENSERETALLWPKASPFLI